MREHAITVAAVLALASAGCLEPLVDDDVPPGDLVLPAGTMVPDAHTDVSLEAQIAEFDGVDGVVPLLSGFAQGAPTRFWDFGPTPEFSAPVLALVRRDGNGGFEMVEHNTIIDVLPGDPGYSPYWAVVFLIVTDSYDGELLTSFDAVVQAEQLGLIEPPVGQPFAVNCPVVAADVSIEVGAAEPVPPPSRFYWKGRTVRYYDFGVMPVLDDAIVPESAMYVLRREGQEPLSEPIRNVDITGDGDITDTNNVFTWARAAADYSPLCRTVDVAVPSTYASIDTSADESIADFMDETDMFDPMPVPGAVVAFEVTEELGNCPQQSVPGGL